jgi:hypothetical protein
LLDLLEALLPIGNKGWDKVAREYNAAAKDIDAAQRTVSALEGRFRKVCCWLTVVIGFI